jgi:hypothetical protein
MLRGVKDCFVFLGALRLHSSDISRLQRLLDPLLVTLLFMLLVRGYPYHVATHSVPAWLWVSLCAVLLLPQCGIYRNCREGSLFTLARRVTSSWLLVLTGLLLIHDASKTSSFFSRLDISFWCLASWLLLLLNHVGLRGLLRWYRSRGGNSRAIVYCGSPEAAADFASQLQRNPWMGFHLAAWFSPNSQFVQASRYAVSRDISCQGVANNDGFNCNGFRGGGFDCNGLSRDLVDRDGASRDLLSCDLESRNRCSRGIPSLDAPRFAPGFDCANPHGLPACGGNLSEMRRWLDTNNVDRIVFSHVGSGGFDMEQVLNILGDTVVPVIYAPHWAQAGMSFNVEHIGKQCCLQLWGSERNFLSRQIKWSLDLLLAAVGLVLISPLLLVIAIAVKLTSPGPVLFVQDRYGLDGHRFRIYKFRTMTVQEAGDATGLQQARRDDPRVTPLGGFLRRWSLDELPQLYNVLKGDMSLVGPRPHAVSHNEQYRKLIPGYMQRHGFKPGITGLAQVQGWRGETSSIEAMVKRVESDLSYQRDWSLKLDLKIMIKTLLRLRSDNAY